MNKLRYENADFQHDASQEEKGRKATEEPIARTSGIVPIEHLLTRRPARPDCSACRDAKLHKAAAYGRSDQGELEDQEMRGDLELVSID